MSTPTKINLSKLRNCNQAWEDMPENERGRLCLKCSNTILDFRKASDSEIAKAHLFSENTVCGLYRRDQLLEPKRKAEWTERKSSWRSAYFAVFGFLSFQANAQESMEPAAIEQREKDPSCYDREETKQTAEQKRLPQDSIVISGRVMDSNKEPLAFANVIVKGTEIGVTTDFDGFYRLNITELLHAQGKLILRYSSIGSSFQDWAIELETVKEEQNRSISVELEQGEIVEYVVYERQPFHKRVWNSITGLFKKDE